MENAKNVGKPGRRLFFRNKKDGGGQQQHNSVAVLEGESVDLGTENKAQLASLLNALKAAREGDFSIRLPVQKDGVMGEIAGVFNDVIGLNEGMAKEVAGLFTATTPTLMGGTSITETHISTITDSIILLRYVEMYGEMRWGLTVLKMRGSMHDKDIREFTIDGSGMHIGKPFRDVTGIIEGSPRHVAASEAERISSLFAEEKIA
jgi:KaiC/GvpD/RAD55 family RecA-like ATPase